MAFQFGTNWSVLARMSGPIQGPLLSYETFTAFFLEASFFWILLFGRPRVPPWFYLFSTGMVALGTTLSAFWIMANNSWMQVPVGYAIEGRWHDEQPASEVLFAIPDLEVETNHYQIAIPILGSLIGSISFTSKEVGLTGFPPRDRPPVIIPFFTFRIMVGCWLVMLLVAWTGSYLIYKERIEQSRPVLWAIFLSFPLPFVAILTGWYTAEVGRKPWTVYGVLRTADAMTPFLTARTALTSLVVFCLVYSFIFAFGTYYIHRLLRAGPAGRLAEPAAAAIPNRPMSVAGEHRLTPPARRLAAGE
jgi:cytochrome d ubiquinol oxidase subunit I